MSSNTNTITQEQQLRSIAMEIISQITDLSNKVSKLTSIEIDGMLGIKKKNVKLSKNLEAIFSLGEEISKLALLSSDTKKDVQPISFNTETNDSDPIQPQVTTENKTISVADVNNGGGIKEETPKPKVEKKKKEEQKPKEEIKKSLEESIKKIEEVTKTIEEQKQKVEKTNKEETPKEKVDDVKKPKQQKGKKEEIIETPKPKEEIKQPPVTQTTEEISSEDETTDKMDDKLPLSQRRKNIPKHIKTLVWNKYIGRETVEAKCLSCKQEKIDMRNFHCGHVLAEAKGGDLTINNLRPICAPCNLSMGTKSMNEFTQEFFGWTV
jgi:hypothetical protein